ncbi:MAG: RNA polymerase factor sigma-54 [Opitutae bacterium]|nr:RNA polymerase factor sigma-54 [Opitutae bacterium]
MAMQSQGLRQVQKQTQNLVLAPQLRQSLKILQVPALELRSAILEELQTNPLLEELGNNDESLDASEVEPSPDELEVEKVDEFPEEPGSELEGKDSDKEQDIESENQEELQDLDFSDEFAILKEMEEDLREHFESEFEGEAKLGNTDAQDKRKFFFDSLTSEVSLQEHLLDQLKLTEISQGVRDAAEYLIGSLDENGFLNSNLSDIALLSSMPLADLQEALSTLQTFEPIGIASIDLQDCLIKQMEARDWEDTDQYRIVKDHFPLLVRRRVPELSRKLSQSTQVIHEAIEKISELDPAPGKRFSEDNNQSISADATVEKVGDEWVISLNSDFIPRLKINRTYKELIAKGVLSSKEKEYVRNQMRAGKFLISSIDQRQNTIERITRKIIERQTGFFEEGSSKLRPMTMSEVADSIEVHETTVSRAIANKFVRTPHGTFPLKYFFTPGYSGKDGDSVSNTSVKEIIGSIIEQEDPSKPLSDRKIVDLLAEKEIKLARRTVAKYREELGISPTNLRRRY